MWGSKCTSIGLSSSGLSNYKWDSVSPSAHKHKNYCQTALSDWLSLFLSLSLPADNWSTAPPTGCVESVFLSFPKMWLKKDFRQIARYWWEHCESTGCGMFCICAVHLCSDSSWLSLIPRLARVSVLLWSGLAAGFPEETQQVRVANQKRRKCNQFLTNATPLF